MNAGSDGLPTRILWFDEWESEFSRVGFGSHHNDNGSFIIPENQLKRIINFDQTALSLDGSEGRCEHQSAVEFYNPNLHAAYKRTSKLSMTITMTIGLSAAGEPLAPHFQFPTKAKNKENMKIECKVLEKMKCVKGQFGCETNRD